MMIMQGYGEISLAKIVAQLARESVCFSVVVEQNGRWTINLTGGF